jgi:hypothetical protein
VNRGNLDDVLKDNPSHVSAYVIFNHVLSSEVNNATHLGETHPVQLQATIQTHSWLHAFQYQRQHRCSINLRQDSGRRPGATCRRQTKIDLAATNSMDNRAATHKSLIQYSSGPSLMKTVGPKRWCRRAAAAFNTAASVAWSCTVGDRRITIW